MLFDVEHNHFWLDEWGPRPESLALAQDKVRELVAAAAPTLIPIYAHRMIPDRPHQSGNPVFSVHQTDVICYGIDLRDYLIHEFYTATEGYVWPIPANVRRIEFWDLERFQDTRWDENGTARFDNRRGILPTGDESAG